MRMENLRCILALLIVLSPIHDASSLLDTSAMPNHIGREMREHHGTERWKDSFPIHFSSSQKRTSDNTVYAAHVYSRQGKDSKKNSKKGSKKSSKRFGSYSSYSTSSSKSSDIPNPPTHPNPTSQPNPTSYPTTTPSITNSSVPNSDDGGDRPPVGSPTRPPNTIECDVDALFSAYAIEYTLQIAAGDIPSLDDYKDLAVVVERYISEYLTSQFSDSNTVMMTGVTTITGNLDFRSPVIFADYESRACFRKGSEIPSVQTLDTALAGILSTQQRQDLFISAVKTLLPTGNIFKSSLVGVESGNPQRAARLNGSKGGSTAVLASAIAGATVLAAGIILYKRRSSGGRYVENLKPPSKLRGEGGSTVAGETFTGESYTTVSPTAYSRPKIPMRPIVEVERRQAVLPPPPVVQHGSAAPPRRIVVSYPTKRANTIDSDECIGAPIPRNSGAISREDWKRELDEDTPRPASEIEAKHCLAKYDAFLEDSDEEDDPNLSIYAEDLEVAGKLLDPPEQFGVESRSRYTVDEIEEMLLHPI